MMLSIIVLKHDVFEAITLLRKRGLQAHRGEDGLQEWRATGLPVEASLQCLATSGGLP
jgi:hypothetical protein